MKATDLLDVEEKEVLAQRQQRYKRLNRRLLMIGFVLIGVAMGLITWANAQDISKAFDASVVPIFAFSYLFIAAFTSAFLALPALLIGLIRAYQISYWSRFYRWWALLQIAVGSFILIIFLLAKAFVPPA